MYSATIFKGLPSDVNFEGTITPPPKAIALCDLIELYCQAPSKSSPASFAGAVNHHRLLTTKPLSGCLVALGSLGCSLGVLG